MSRMEEDAVDREGAESPSTGVFAAILEAVRRIPPGSVASYGQVARAAGVRGGGRVVGWALASMAPDSSVPWHRVVNAQGQISMRRHDWQSGSDDYQRAMLENEGIEFSAAGKINLKKFRWLVK